MIDPPELDGANYKNQCHPINNKAYMSNKNVCPLWAALKTDEETAIVWINLYFWGAKPKIFQSRNIYNEF